ncbi:hypothetical protein MMIC_P2041 [Mariprofundus micogutta]|uniref:DUF4156 domain-containing protein n=1 Tax=Mariprofundus micogutta TaxID=1921010 RepID=A0A1L8CQ56_9PROT|nr:DUF4156 domain-containing protein [Mariprofundus micogutta]GAV21062.1 hypothetical protein MMIC_P2041 [Mariprofundus micogutta]
MNKQLILIALLVAGLSACTWVEVDPQAQGVRVAELSQVTSCKHLGKATVSLLDKVLFVSRGEKQVEEELERLGRNSAAEMDGDTIVPMSKVIDGERVFNVYQCK